MLLLARLERDDYILSIVMHHYYLRWLVYRYPTPRASRSSTLPRSEGRDPLSDIKSLPIQYRDFLGVAEAGGHDSMSMNASWNIGPNTSEIVRLLSFLSDLPRPLAYHLAKLESSSSIEGPT